MSHLVIAALVNSYCCDRDQNFQLIQWEPFPLQLHITSRAIAIDTEMPIVFLFLFTIRAIVIVLIVAIAAIGMAGAAIATASYAACSRSGNIPLGHTFNMY